MSSPILQSETDGELEIPTRRTFMGAAVGLLSALLAALVGIPVLGAIFSAAIRPPAQEGWAPVGAPDQFPDGQYIAVDYMSTSQDGWMKGGTKQTVWVRRKGQEFEALSAVCTHAGCRVGWRPDRNQFVCPCHGGVYNADGINVSGPPPKPLARFDVKVAQGQVSIKPTAAV